MRLSQSEIREILLAHSQGVPISKIAQDAKVDPSTVRYHIEAFEKAYGSTDAIYAMIRPVQLSCNHPSLKCLVCGQGQDNLHRMELEEITRLTFQLKEARDLLESLGQLLD